MAGLNQLGQNGAQEFFETILYGVGYTEAQDQIKNWTKDIDSDVLQDALMSMMTVIASGLMFKMIQTQEKYIEKLFGLAESLIVVLLGSGFVQKAMDRFANTKGIKVLKRLPFLSSAFSDRVQVANLVGNMTQTQLHGVQTSQNETSLLKNVQSTKSHIIDKERLNHEVGNSMASRYNDTLMFKLLTKNFSVNDEQLIKKIVGRGDTGEIHADDLNKVADFMFVTDSDGNTTGLSEQFLRMVNATGYTNKIL